MSDSTSLRWRAQRLGDLVERRVQRNSARNRNVLTISAIDGLVSQTEYFNRVVASVDLSPYYLLERGDFAYNKSYSTGHPVGVIRRLERYESGVVSPLYICFRPRGGRIDSDFLEQLLRAGMLDDGIAIIAKEGARNHGLLNVSAADLLDLPIDVPPLHEQRRIAEILDAIDETIRATERIISKTRSFRDELVRAEIARAQGATLARVGTVITHAEYGISEPLADTDGIPVLRMGNLSGGRIDLTDLRYSHRTPTTLPLLKRGDILFNRTNSIDRVGKTAIWRGELQCATFASYLVRLHVSDAVRAEYLNLWMNLPETQISIRRWATTAVQQVNINPTNLRRTVMPLLPIEEQVRVVATVGPIDTRLDRESRFLRSQRRLRSGLAADLLSGRVRTG